MWAGDPSFPSYPRVAGLQSRRRKTEHCSGGLGNTRLLAALWRALCCGTVKAGSHPSLRSRTDFPLGSSLERSCLGLFPDRNCHQMPLSSGLTQMIPGFPIIQIQALLCLEIGSLIQSDRYPYKKRKLREGGGGERTDHVKT